MNQLQLKIPHVIKFILFLTVIVLLAMIYAKIPNLHAVRSNSIENVSTQSEGNREEVRQVLLPIETFINGTFGFVDGESCCSDETDQCVPCSFIFRSVSSSRCFYDSNWVNTEVYCLSSDSRNFPMVHFIMVDNS